MQKDLIAVKKEEDKEEPGPVRPRTVKGKGKGKEPIRQTAHEEASDAPADQIMEDEPLEHHEPLFGTFRALTVPKALSHPNIPCSPELSALPSFHI